MGDGREKNRIFFVRFSAGEGREKRKEGIWIRSINARSCEFQSRGEAYMVFKL